MTARRVSSLLAVAALVAVVFVSTGAGAASAASGPPPPKRAHPTIGPAPGLRSLTIKTIPPTPGATFTFEGQSFTTAADGAVTVTITQQQRDLLATNRNDALVVTSPTVNVSKDIRANFAGWYGNGSYKSGVETQTATFSYDYLTSFKFVNTKGDPVQPSLLSSMELKSSVGATIDLRSTDPVWLQGRLVTPGAGGVDVRDVSYRINEVIVAGSNVVNAAQQQFFPTQRTTATVRLLFFSVRFVATDAMLGGGVGKSIELQYPDGKVRTIALGPTHSVTVDDLPRGDYHVTVVGGGLRMARPISISRNQEADLDVITYLDVGLVALAILIVAAVVLWFGLSMRRRHHGTGRRAARRRHPAVTTAADAPSPSVRESRDVRAASPVPTSSNGNRPVRVDDRAHGNDLEFLHASADREPAERASTEAVAEAFADADEHVSAAKAAGEHVPHDPDEVSANEHFLVDGPGRRQH